jgi:hypothetical protein
VGLLRWNGLSSTRIPTLRIMYLLFAGARRRGARGMNGAPEARVISSRDVAVFLGTKVSAS